MRDLALVEDVPYSVGRHSRLLTLEYTTGYLWWKKRQWFQVEGSGTCWTYCPHGHHVPPWLEWEIIRLLKAQEYKSHQRGLDL